MTDTTRIALAGEFAVLSQLALRGFDANMTLGNTKGVDILVSEPDTSRMIRLEVKTTTKSSSKSRLWGHTIGWVMSRKHEGSLDPGLFYCFVNLSGNSFSFYVVPSSVVAEYVREEHKLWLEGDSARKDTSMRTFRLGLASDGYPLPTPFASEYEDAWDLLR